MPGRRSATSVMSPYDLIIFDCDGVLIDSELLSCNTLIDLLRQHGINVDLDVVFDRFLGRSPQAIVDYCASSARPLPDDFQAKLSMAVREAFATSLKPVPGAAKVLRGLQTHYCVASSSDLERMDYSLRSLGFLPSSTIACSPPKWSGTANRRPICSSTLQRGCGPRLAGPW